MQHTFDASKAPIRLETALVVDNDRMIRAFFSKLLEQSGLRVETAVDGVNALDILETFTPDLMFIDLVMPNIDGRTLCQILRKKPEFKETFIVIVSAIAAEDGTDIVNLGADLCMAKVGFADMEIMIQRVLNDPVLLSRTDLKDKILGVDDLSPRGITKELLAINHQSKIVLDSISNGIITINDNHRIIYANPSALRFFAMAAETMLGNPVSRILTETAGDNASTLIADILSTDCSASNKVKITVNNRVIDVCMVSTDTGNGVKVIILEDITDREKAQTALVDANAQLHRLALVDGLTSVSNRRHFDELLHQEWGRMRREKKQLSLMLCDVDYFKDYNDAYGHLKGDRCLKDIAATVKGMLRRPSDNVARYGGDEFVILLPDTSIDGARTLAEKILDRINRLKIAHDASKSGDHVTMTIGIGSGFPTDAVPEDKFIWLADKALYEAKNNGRNCFVAKTLQQPYCGRV